MARHKNKREEEVLTGNLTAMIDVVFQLIIFFVATVSMQESAIDSSIVLPPSPHGAPVEGRDPNEIRIDVDKGGVVRLCRMPISENDLTSILSKTMTDTGLGSKLPVVIRGDTGAKHKAVKKVMDACSRAGISKIKFVAIRDAVPK